MEPKNINFHTEQKSQFTMLDHRFPIGEGTAPNFGSANAISKVLTRIVPSCAVLSHVTKEFFPLV